MGREVRRVPADWQHPKHEVPDWKTGQMVERYKPLYPGNRYAPRAAEFMYTANCKGLQEAVDDCGCPDKDDYMPDWPIEQCTHLMMYEDTTEGTPISPAFATPEELARWLADTGASAFGKSTGSYDGWLRVARGGFAPSMVVSAEGSVTGVDVLESTGENSMSETNENIYTDPQGVVYDAVLSDNSCHECAFEAVPCAFASLECRPKERLDNRPIIWVKREAQRN